MVKYFLIPIFLLFALTSNVIGQSFNVNFLFNPGITLGSEYLTPTAINDSIDFKLNTQTVQFVIPLKTKFGVKGLTFKDFSFKKLDAKASQLFLTSKVSASEPLYTENNTFSTIYTVDIGFTAVSASIRKGIWLYSANIYFSENTKTLTKNPVPNFRGYMAKVKIKSLDFIYFYGGSIIVNQGKFIPVPLFGFRKSLSPKINTLLIFPVQATINYKASKKIKLNLGVNFKGLNPIYREGSALQNNDNTYNFRQLKTFIGVNGKLGKHIKLTSEFGYSSLQKIYGVSSGSSQSVAPTPYVSISLNYHFGKSVFGNFVNSQIN